jgi:hypothetical protein
MATFYIKESLKLGETFFNTFYKFLEKGDIMGLVEDLKIFLEFRILKGL